MVAEDRRLRVLRAIVSEYVRTQEPVGSKNIASTHSLGVSPATIRNDMSFLEENGLIYQPHTSAGRVPTEKGYRLFVDRLSTIKPMSKPERRAVESFLSQSVDLDDVVQRTVRLLAQVTHQVAVVQYPVLSTSTLRHLELVDLGPRRVLLVAITNGGHVGEHLLDLEKPVDSNVLQSVQYRLNIAFENSTPDEVRAGVADLLSEEPQESRGLTEKACSVVLSLIRTTSEERVVMSGLSNLARKNVDFHDMAPLLDALEEHVALIRLFSEIESDPSDVHVSIGRENAHDAFAEAAVVTGTYGAYEGAGAHLGVVGPTRMDYSRTMSVVRAVSAYLTRFMTS